MEKVRHVSHLLKLVAPGTRVVWGGPEAGFWPETVLARDPSVDVVVRGEGEVTFVELLKRWAGNQDLSGVLGIVHRDNGRIVVEPDRPAVADLDTLPSPYLAGVLDPKEEPESNHIVLEGFRECPYRCGYCTSPGRPRFFSLERLRKEIEFCFEQDVESFALIDPFVNMGRSRLTDLADILHGIDPNQTKCGAVFVMAELLTPKDVDAMVRMNVPLVKTGIQSTNQAVLHNIRRRVDPGRFANGIRLLQSAGLRTSLHLLAGLPGDTFDGLRRTLEFAISLKPGNIMCFSTLLLPGSYLYDQRERLRIVFDERPPHRILSHYSLDFEQMIESLEFGYAVSCEYNGLDAEARQRGLELDMDRWGALSGTRRVRRYNTGR